MLNELQSLHVIGKNLAHLTKLRDFYAQTSKLELDNTQIMLKSLNKAITDVCLTIEIGKKRKCDWKFTQTP